MKFAKSLKIKAIFSISLILAVFHSKIYAKEIVIAPDTVYEGSLNVVTIKNKEKKASYRILLKLENKWLGFEFPKDSSKGLFAVPLNAPSQIRFIVTKNKKVRVFAKTIKVKRRGFLISKINVKKTFAEPGPKLRKRIAKERKLLREILSRVTPPFMKGESMIKPIPYARISSFFGATRIVNGVERGRHLGVDFSAQKDTPVHAALSGRVVLARELFYTGKTVVIDHGRGLYTLYAHLSRMNVKEGDFVLRGEIIGHVGKTGRSTGYHLHFGVYFYGIAVDPMDAMKLIGGDLKT